MKEVDLIELYWEWCKKTKRNGGVLVGGSIREFLEYVEDNCITFKREEYERNYAEEDRTDP